MKKIIASFFLLFLFFSARSQDRQGKQFDEQNETKRYKFSYEKTKMSDGVSVSLPKGFRALVDGETKLKYPNFHKPVKMMTSEDQVADFGYNISFNQWGKNLKLLKEFVKSNHTFYFTDIQYLQDTILAMNGRNFIVLEFISNTLNKETDRQLPPIFTYSYMMYTVEDNKILVFNYTCPARNMGKWKQAAPAIMSSIKINPSLDLTNATSQIPKKTKGKKISDISKEEAKKSPKQPSDSKAK
jgi:hypothetical protein